MSRNISFPKLMINRLLIITVLFGIPSISFGWFGSNEVKMVCPNTDGTESIYRYQRDTKKITIREKGKWEPFCWVVEGPVSDGKDLEFQLIQSEDVWDLGGSCTSKIIFPTNTTESTTSYDFEYFLREWTETLINEEYPLGRQVREEKIQCRSLD